MPRYVAFLRAINVGGHTVKMDHLRGLFEALKLANVETFIASGNVIFDSRASDSGTLERKIEKHLQASLGYEVRTFVRTMEEVAAVAAHKPFADREMIADGNIIYVGFMGAMPQAPAQLKLQSLANEANDFQIREREVFWLRRTKKGESDYAGALFEKALAQPVTFRSVNTVKRIAAKYLTS